MRGDVFIFVFACYICLSFNSRWVYLCTRIVCVEVRGSLSVMLWCRGWVACIIIIVIIMGVQVAVAQLPASYDSRSLWKEHCTRFSVIHNQGNCSSCCAMALSSAISARECMRDGRDIVYSAQQIWDCVGESASATCNDGAYLDNLIRSLGRGVHSSQSLI